MPMPVAGTHLRMSSRPRLASVCPAPMTRPVTAPPTRAATGRSTRPTTAVPARPASGKARNPAVQISQVRRRDASGRAARHGGAAPDAGSGRRTGGGDGRGAGGRPSSSVASAERAGRSRSTTPRAATHSPQLVLPMRPPRSQTGKPGTAVARMSPWLVRYSALTTSPATPSQRGSTRLRRMITLSVTDQAMASSWPRCSPSSAPPNWCCAVQAASTAALVGRRHR